MAGWLERPSRSRLPKNDILQSSPQFVGDGAHFRRPVGGQLALAVEVPEFEPMIKELGLNADTQVRAREASSIGGRAAGLQCPEVGDLGEVDIPVLDVCVENGSQDLVLPDVHVEGADELKDAFVAAELGVECFGI